MKAVYLYPRSSFVTELRSDTLWGLLMVAIRYVFSEEKLLQLLKKFADNQPPFLISSAMPFAIKSDGTILHFLPKVVTKPKLGEISIKLRKKIKEISFIPKNYYEDFINGRIDEVELANKLFENTNTNDEFNPDLVKSLIKPIGILHNRIDLLTNTTGSENGQGQLFLTSEYFIANGGLYFILDGEDISIVEPALRFLTHFGFGGDHSIGKGAFNFEIREFDLEIPKDANIFTTLSLYNPKPEELSFFLDRKDFVYYELTQRAGIIGAQFKIHSYRKKSFFAFREGSTFPMKKNYNYYGRLLKTMDEPTAYSYCYAFTIPVKFKE